jgi:hypothetical protein
VELWCETDLMSLLIGKWFDDAWHSIWFWNHWLHLENGLGNLDIHRNREEIQRVWLEIQWSHHQKVSNGLQIGWNCHLYQIRLRVQRKGSRKVSNWDQYDVYDIEWWGQWYSFATIKGFLSDSKQSNIAKCRNIDQSNTVLNSIWFLQWSSKCLRFNLCESWICFKQNGPKFCVFL